VRDASETSPPSAPPRARRVPPWWVPLVSVLVGLLYGVSPIDGIPDAVPVLGLLDDLGFVGSALLVAFLTWRQRARAVASRDGGAR
jgi:uncharacterized membrane protein YkvA (DUF1232 family)